MHSLELVRLAAVIAATAESLALRATPIPADALTGYWLANRERFELWDRGLMRFRELEELGRLPAMHDWWSTHLPMIEEILVSEVLTRVMAAVGAMIDARVTQHHVEPLTQSVYRRHLEARGQVLRLLLFGRGGSVEDNARLNRLRSTAEHWVDTLIAPLIGPHPETLRYTIDAAQALRLGQDAGTVDLPNPATLPTDRFHWPLIERSLASLVQPRAALPHANRQIGEVVLACLGERLFDSFGVLQSATTNRIRSGISQESRPLFDRPDSHPLFRRQHLPGVSPNPIRWTS